MQVGVTVQCCAMWAAGGGVGAEGKARGYLCRCLKCAAKSHIKILPSLSKEFFDLAIKRGLGGTWGAFVEP